MATIEHLDAMLIAEDIDATVEFYCDKLGFELGFIIKEGIIPYASVYRDDVSLNFREGKINSEPGENGGIVIQVDEIDEYYEELKKRGALSEDFPKSFPSIREHPPEDKDYGIRDMFMLDPNGYIIQILTPLDEEE